MSRVEVAPRMVRLIGPCQRWPERPNVHWSYLRMALPSAALLVVTVRARRIGYYPGHGAAQVVSGRANAIEVGLDVVLVCLDACPAAPVSTPGYVRPIP